MRDTTEALEIFDRLPSEWQDKLLVLMRLLVEGDADKIRLFYELEGFDPNKDYENPA